LKSFRSFDGTRLRLVCAGVAMLSLGAAAMHARADLPRWMQYAVSGSAIEGALYRLMDLPGLNVLYPRPPAEARVQIDSLVQGKPTDAQLYALRAHVEEQALDFVAAEKDWVQFAAHAQDKAAAFLQLADFYKRRVQGPQEIAALDQSAAQPTSTQQTFLAADQQSSWQSFVRALTVVQEDALGDDAAVGIYRAWIARYPAEPAVRANFINALLTMKRYADTQTAIADYQKAFPQDTVFPIRATALLALQQGNANAMGQAQAMLEKAYQPLWPQPLLDSYFQLLNANHAQHAMLDAARAQLAAHPDDLGAMTRIYYYFRQQGQADSAANTLAQYGASKESRHAAWSTEELYTLATLLARTQQYQEAARYYFALAVAQGTLTATPEKPDQAALAGMVQLLFTAPESSIALGAGNLSLYRDIATIDDGPGYWNGLLSLWLNSQSTAQEFSAEEQKATPYFHRAKAAELLAVLDQRYPASPERSELHAELIQAYAGYGQDAAVQKEGEAFLAQFPHAGQRLEVAMEVADADARVNDTKDEFALYDSLLAELGASLQGMPLTAAGTKPAAATPAADDSSTDVSSVDTSTTTATANVLSQSLAMPVNPPATAAAASEYQQILERYLGRLTIARQTPAALVVLRRELDRNPNDPALYERLADFLQQNNLGAEQEEVYQKAIAHFNDETFYDKLARFYLRNKRAQDYLALSRKVVDAFQGTELEGYFANATGPWPQEFLQLNLYAHQRFPHEIMFTRNLLQAYQDKATANPSAWEQLIRQHWEESPDLQAQFFDWLSQTEKLDAEMASLQTMVATATLQQQNPAATRELAELDISRSHFEQSAPLLGGLAAQYPADPAVGDDAASIYRSLAYEAPENIATAVEIEKRLSQADPGNLDRLATIGDIYADSTSSEMNLNVNTQLALAAPYWRQIAAVHRGMADGYLTSATVFWDYFQFDDALAQITAARKQTNDPALYGYEAGAIDENKNDMSHAVAEYVAAAIAHSNNDGGASARLLTLASKQATADAVDSTTAKAVAQSASPAALELRAEVLAAEQRINELAPLLDTAIQHAGSNDQLSRLADFSLKHQLPHEYQAALLREAALSNDPVQQIELQYQLVNSYEDNGDLADAQKIVTAVYKANPMIVGVVRTTVDFYWSHQQSQSAVTTLLDASHKANATLALAFILEAVDKSNQSGDYSAARTLLKPLLAADPYNAKYLGLEADSFAAAHDPAGLRDFYLATLAAIKTSQLSAADKRDKTAMTRQGLIVALTQLKDYAGATGQHIALLSAFPEDDAVLQAAANYARLYGTQAQLVAFLNQTVAQSPQDSRFSIDLARVDAMYEDYQGALTAYAKAIAVRKDRADLYMAHADIEEHMQAYDAACTDYDRLYTLTYKDPQWMQKEALARARQGNGDLAVKALQAAWIDGKPPAAGDYFKMADQLQQWDMLTQARSFADQGLKLAGDDLLRDSQYSGDAAIYAAVLARQRQSGPALSTLTHLYALGGGSSLSPAIVLKQVQQQGVSAIANQDWRTALAASRQKQSKISFQSALQAISQVAASYYTPEEKTAYARLLDAQRAGKRAQDVSDFWIPAAATADLKDREATWLRDVLLGGGDLGQAQLSPLVALETARMDFTPLGTTLDRYAATIKPADQPPIRTLAVDAWSEAGNATMEASDLRKLAVGDDAAQYQDKLFELLLRSQPTALIQLTAGNDALGDAAATYLIAHGTKTQAYQAIALRALVREPVWANATKALAGLYFADDSPPIQSAFENALGSQIIGDQLTAKPVASRQLVGDPWFYYGTHYGILLTLPSTPAKEPEDFLAAQLELNHADGTNYYALAQTYMEEKHYDDAIGEYSHAQELDPQDATADVDIAEALWSQGKHADAITQWNSALAKLCAIVDVDSVPESFWTNFAQIAKDAREHALGTTLKPSMNTVLEAYIRKNSDYRTPELLHSAMIALDKQNANDAASWVLALVGEAKDSDTKLMLLGGLARSSWFPQPQLDAVYRREIVLATQQQQTAAANGAATEDAVAAAATLAQLQVSYVNWLLANNQTAKAQQVLGTMTAKPPASDDVQTLRILVAARQSQLPALLTSYQKQGADVPSLQVISAAANQMRIAGDAVDSRALLEYVFAQKQAQGQLEPTDFIALAEAQLATNDVLDAVDVLRRFTQQGDLYANLDTASSLLMKTGHPAEALPMLTQLATGVPWQQAYRLELGHAQLALKQNADAAASFIAVAASNNAGYAARAEAAQDLHVAAGAHTFDSIELSLLAAGTPTAAQASQPYFVYAPIAAALATQPAQRASLLSSTLLSAPDALQDWVHLQIFEADMAAAKYQQASVAVAPLVAANQWMRKSSDDAADAADAESSSPDATDALSSDGASDVLSQAIATPRFSIEAQLATTQQKFNLTLSLAEMDEHLKSEALLIQDLEAAKVLTADVAQLTALQARIRAARRDIVLASQNDSRRPTVHPALTQDNDVRPRLVAAAPEVQP
jgi:tetratricopeptide (TPR) repeat protein